jgi:uncharacterized protein (DUF433 family)
MSTINELDSTEPATGLDRLIEIRHGANGPKPCIAGHRIRVQDVAVWWEDLGWSVSEIMEKYPQLSPAKVHAALAYYFEHKDEIRAQMRQQNDLVEQIKELSPPTRLQQKMQETGTKSH